ncbi:hypothetical protein P7C70_g9194, partial [Phenoliferia sp. Uapishka_3]
PPTLEITSRSDSPALPLPPSTTWLAPQAGDQWTADLPRRFLTAADPGADASASMEIVFARAFWESWPLKLERRLVEFLVRIGVGPFKLREGGVDAKEAVSNFGPKAKVIGGLGPALFIVDAHDSHPKLATPSEEVDWTISGPIIASWWLRNALPPKGTSLEMLGGYHSFSVQDLPSSGTSKEEIVRLIFTTHIVLTNVVDHDSPPLEMGSTIPSRELEGLSIVQSSILRFHTFYSRILLDLAVKKLRGRVGPPGVF